MLLTNNCGGKSVIVCNQRTEAFIQFSCWEDAKRALPRIAQEDVFGSKINVSLMQKEKDIFDSIEEYNKKRIANPQKIDFQSLQPPSTEGQTVIAMPYLGRYHRDSSSSAPRRSFSHGPTGRIRENSFGNGYDAYPSRNPNKATPSKSFDVRPFQSTNHKAWNHRVSVLSGGSSSYADGGRRTPLKFNGDHLAENVNNNNNSDTIELVVTYDPALKGKALTKFLEKKMKDFSIKYIHVYEGQHATADGSYYSKAVIRFPSQIDSQLFISKLHGEKIGQKMVKISSPNSPPSALKEEITSIFDVVGKNKIALVTFQDQFEKRFHRRIHLGDLNKINIVEVEGGSEESGHNGKFVRLISRSPAAQPETIFPKCPRHCPTNDDGAWAEYSNGTESLPNVSISLKVLSPRIHHLLDSHEGILPLYSVVNCYYKEFKEEFRTDPNQPLVPLEHLITCVTGVQIIVSKSGHKQICWMENKKDDEVASDDESFYSNPDHEQLSKDLAQFKKELKEVLKSQPRSLIPFKKFVPAYHSHFGKQCCVKKYGFLHLSDLLEAINKVVQVLNDNQSRVLTLTHREQIKRFATDLLKVLKAQQGRKLLLSKFSDAYEKVFEKPFRIADYGVCYIEDVLNEVWQDAITITEIEGDDKLISIPIKEQTHEEIARTKIFATEVIQLLRTTPTFEVSFSKFIPAYHHYFNKQCKVIDYGFSKLIELFEAISSETVEITNSQTNDDKIIRLSYEQRLKAIGQRIERILKKKCQSDSGMPFSMLRSVYKEEYGCKIDHASFGCKDFIDLMIKLPGNKFKIINKCNISLIGVNLKGKEKEPQVKKILQREIKTDSTKKSEISLMNHQPVEVDAQNVDDLLMSADDDDISKRLPSPLLKPTKLNQPDLIFFELDDSINESEVKDLSTPDLLFDLDNLVGNNILENNVVESNVVDDNLEANDLMDNLVDNNCADNSCADNSCIENNSADNTVNCSAASNNDIPLAGSNDNKVKRSSSMSSNVSFRTKTSRIAANFSSN